MAMDQGQRCVDKRQHSNMCLTVPPRWAVLLTAGGGLRGATTCTQALENSQKHCVALDQKAGSVSTPPQAAQQCDSRPITGARTRIWKQK